MSYAQNYLKMDKIDKLFDAIEHPDRYSGTEMEAMLADPDVKEVYDLLYKTRASLAPIPVPDIDNEWKAFEEAHNKRGFSIFKLFSRNVAAGITVVIASIAAVAAVVGVGVNYVLDKKVEAETVEIIPVAEEDIPANDTIVVEDENQAKVPETIVFENEPFETIVNRVAEYYGYKVEFTSDSSKSLRLYFHWNQNLTLGEVVESLNNFGQIHITVKDKTIKID